MIKIYFNPNYPELVFSAAAIMKANKNPNLVALIATYPLELNCQEKERKAIIFQQAQNMVEYYQTNPPKEDLIPADEIYSNLQEDAVYLLNVHPINQQEDDYLIDYIQKNKQAITLWADNSNYWSKGLLNYLASEDFDQLIVSKEKSCLQILKERGFTVPDDWMIAAEGVANGKITNEIIARYITALSAAMVMDNNFFAGMRNYFQTFTHCVNEILHNIRIEDVDILVEDFISASRDLEKIKKSVNDQSRFFINAKKCGRPIGYVELCDVNRTLNLYELLEYGTNKFPWLFIILYNTGEEYNVIADSLELPILEIMETCKELVDESNDLFTLLEKAVINFKK